MMENMRSSNLLYNLWKNSFVLFGFLISISITINSLKFIVYLGKVACFINSIGQNGEKDNGTC